MIEIWHNPRCSKSRAALKILEDSGKDFQQRLYLQNPPTPEEIQRVVKKLGVSVADIVRKKEPEYEEHRIASLESEDQKLAEKLFTVPKLIERPIVINGSQAVIGRPPENIEKIL